MIDVSFRRPPASRLAHTHRRVGDVLLDHFNGLPQRFGVAQWVTVSLADICNKVSNRSFKRGLNSDAKIRF